jgi:hypothetical protein
MSKSKKSDELLKIRTAWWKSFLELSHAIYELKGSKAKKEQASELLGKLISAFNAASFQDPTFLDALPPEERPRTRKSPARKTISNDRTSFSDPPATKRNLTLVPPPTVH